MLSQSLNPARFTAMSGKMAALVGCIIGEKFTDPSLEEIVVTSDGIVLARAEEDCGCNEWIGSISDLKRNWDNLLTAAELSDEDRQEAETAFRNTVKMF